VVGALLIVLINLKARWEERHLEQPFPDHAADARRTPRLIPRSNRRWPRFRRRQPPGSATEQPGQESKRARLVARAATPLANWNRAQDLIDVVAAPGIGGLPAAATRDASAHTSCSSRSGELCSDRSNDGSVDLVLGQLLGAEEPVDAGDAVLLTVHPVLGRAAGTRRGDDHRLPRAPVIGGGNIEGIGRRTGLALRYVGYP
jgi:hypothetical protein